jgi:serine protease Do
MDELEPINTPEMNGHSSTGHWPLALAVVLTGMLALGLLTLYIAPVLTVRWRVAADEAAADAAYLRRQAELRADSESANSRLEELDRRLHFVSLGFREVARKVAPVVVHIGNEIEDKGDPDGPGFFDFEGDRAYVERAEGSGILVEPGYVLTNRHVVNKAQRVRVTFASGRSLVASPDAISFDQPTDLAIIRLPESHRPSMKADYSVCAEFADSNRDVQVGDWVLAAGSPFGLRQSVTAGIISAKGRVDVRILDFVELLQTDAAINPGNSGGPLFDLHGRVVGINVAIASDNGRSDGVGFAIPSNTVREVFEQLKEYGKVERGFLGVLMREIVDGAEDRLGIANTGGVLVQRVEANSPAAEAGFRNNDLIVRLNDEPVGTGNAVRRLRQHIARLRPGTDATVEVVRNGRPLKLEVTLGKRPAAP